MNTCKHKVMTDWETDCLLKSCGECGETEYDILREAAQAVVDAEMARRNDAETNTLVWILNHRDLIDELAKALEQGD